MLNLKFCGIIAGTAFFLSFLLGFLTQASMPTLILRPLIFALIFFVISLVINILASRFLPELLEEGTFDTDSGPFAGGNAPGSRVDITEGDFPGDSFGGPTQAPGPGVLKPVFLGAQPDDSENGLGNITELYQMNLAPKLTLDSQAMAAPAAQAAQAGMDQNVQDDYTGAGVPSEFLGDDAPLDFGLGASAAEAPPEDRPAPAGNQGSADTSGMPMDFSASGDILPDLDSMAGAFVSPSLEVEPDTDNTEYSVGSPRKPLSTSKTPAMAGDYNAKELAKGIQTALSKDKEG